jgi:peptide chain release factor 1
METIIMEIDSAAGGDEAELFAHELYRMYSAYAAKKHFKIQELSSEPIQFKIKGEGVYNVFQFEGGVHRVQRVPKTEKKGRVHTSTVTVSVIKEGSAAKIDIDENDLEITACRSSGAGGQNVNKVSSKIRAIHKPTGIVVECQEERSQLMNKQKAIEKLRAILNEDASARFKFEQANARKQQVGTGSRNEKIRTYNFKDNRLTDHRIKFESKKLNKILDGDLDELLTALQNKLKEE